MPTVLAIAAHPDDIEFLMAGTLLRLQERGYEAHYWNLADGCCGSLEHDRATTAGIRLAEARAAAASLGCVFHEPLASDLEIFYEPRLLARVAAVVREVAPTIVLTHAPSDYMEDHMNACRLAVTATFCRGMPNFPVDPPRPAIDTPATVYHGQPYGNVDPLGAPVRPTRFVDVSDLVDRKAAALALHVSQKAWLDASQGLDSYLETMRALGREVGAMSGRFANAEGWRRHLHLGFCDAAADPLVAALGEQVLVTDAA